MLTQTNCVRVVFRSCFSHLNPSTTAFFYNISDDRPRTIRSYACNVYFQNYGRVSVYAHNDEQHRSSVVHTVSIAGVKLSHYTAAREKSNNNNRKKKK